MSLTCFSIIEDLRHQCNNLAKSIRYGLYLRVKSIELCRVWTKYGNLFKEQRVVGFVITLASAYMLCCLLAIWLQFQRNRVQESEC